jgi:hypothetical protein
VSATGIAQGNGLVIGINGCKCGEKVEAMMMEIHVTI